MRVANSVRRVIASMCLMLPVIGLAEPSDDTVRIMVLTELSGGYANDIVGEGAITAAELAAEDFDWSVAGSEIEILYADTEEDPSTAAAALSRANDEKHVDLVTGTLLTSVSKEVLDVAESEGITVIHNGASSAELTGKHCSPIAVHWGYDTYALAKAVVRANIDQGAKDWFFLTEDYSFGRDLKAQASRFIREHGGRVVGESVHEHPTRNYSQGLEKAIRADADVVGLAIDDLLRAVRQGYEVGLQSEGINLIALEFFISDIRQLELYVTSGLRFATSFYWDQNPATRAFAKRFKERMGSVPTSPQAGVYSSVLHYLEAVEAIEGDNARAVVAEMRRHKVDDDVFASNGRIRRDGRMVHDMILAEVKKSHESQGAWDYLNVLQTIPGDKAFRPMSKGNCRL